MKSKQTYSSEETTRALVLASLMPPPKKTTIGEHLANYLMAILLLPLLVVGLICLVLAPLDVQK